MFPLPGGERIFAAEDSSLSNVSHTHLKKNVIFFFRFDSFDVLLENNPATFAATDPIVVGDEGTVGDLGAGSPAAGEGISAAFSVPPRQGSPPGAGVQLVYGNAEPLAEDGCSDCV